MRHRTPDPRALAVAVNAAEGLWRPAACRLAAAPEAWAQGTRRRARNELARAIGVPREQLDRALEIVPTAAAVAAEETARAAALGARIVTCFDDDYPEPLRDLALPPPVLYVRGDPGTAPAVAIVGSRRASPHGLEAAGLFAGALAEAGVTVVSGFARGIDAAAHRGALADGGRTVAVLGCGLGLDYPRGHRPLADEIAAAGALITEFRSEVEPRRWHFPVRNRVIAALARSTLVVEAAPRSGSLITARHALELGRDIYAVPGRIFDERSLGPNTLIRDGAYLALCPQDVLDGLPTAALPARAAPPQASPEREEEPPPGPLGKVLEALPRGEGRGTEELAAALGWPLDRLLGALLELELAGRVRRLPGPLYQRTG